MAANTQPQFRPGFRPQYRGGGRGGGTRRPANGPRPQGIVQKLTLLKLLFPLENMSL